MNLKIANLFPPKPNEIKNLHPHECYTLSFFIPNKILRERWDRVESFAKVFQDILWKLVWQSQAWKFYKALKFEGYEALSINTASLKFKSCRLYLWSIFGAEKDCK